MAHGIGSHRQHADRTRMRGAAKVWRSVARLRALSARRRNARAGGMTPMRQRSTRKLVVYAATFVALLASVVSATFFMTPNAGAQAAASGPNRVTGTAQPASIAASAHVRPAAATPSSAAHIQQAAARDIPF